jgi:hypothetical protein
MPSYTPTIMPSDTPVPTATPTATITLSPTRTLVPLATDTPQPRNCPGVLRTRLEAGGQGRVSDDDPRPLNVRSGPGTNFPRVGQLAIGSTFDVIEGPQCNDGFAWFLINRGGNFEGWIAESDASGYFVEPVNAPAGGAARPEPAPSGSRVLGPGCRPLVEDEFTGRRSTNEWFTDDTGSGPSTEQIIDGYYEISLNELTDGATEATSWGSLRGRRFRDMRVEAVISASRWSPSAPSRTGLWLRYQDASNFLAFMIASTGNYRIARFERGYTSLVDWTRTGAIRTGNGAVNTVRIDVRGDTFDFYINGDYITTVVDDTWADGRIAFWGSSEMVPTAFFLDYFRVCPN